MEIYAQITDPYGHTMIAKLIKDDNGEMYWKRYNRWDVINKTMLKIKTSSSFIGKKEKDLFTIFSDQPFNEKEFKEALDENCFVYPSAKPIVV
jgi:hypothetical protein